MNDTNDLHELPDLTHYLAIHRQMRVDTRRIVAALEAAVPGDRGRRLDALARWITGFGHELHVHHTIEDDVLFPDLVRREPAAASTLADLAEDHDVVSSILLEWSTAATRVAHHAFAFEPARREMLALAEQLRDLLATHLDIEDDEILPLFQQHYTSSSWEALLQQATKHIPKRGLTFSIPWNVEAMPESSRDELVRTAPKVLVMIHRLFGGRFRRLTAVAFAAVDGSVRREPVGSGTAS